MSSNSVPSDLNVTTDLESVTTSSIVIYGHQDGTSEHLTVDAMPLFEKMQYQNQMLFLNNVLLFAILIFMAFRLAFRGLWR